MPSKINQRFAFIKNKYIILFTYIIFYAILFSRDRHGIGQYWDWAFPYYKHNLSNFFFKNSISWTAQHSGSPLSYSSDYYFRMVVALFGFINTESVIYGLLIFMFSVGSFGVYLICKYKVRNYLAITLGLLSFVNPAIFYKYTAGHIDYLASIDIFIYLIYFLFYKYRSRMRDNLIVALLLSFIGIQIQFLVIVPLFLILYILSNKKIWNAKSLMIITVIPLIVNSVWILNFVNGASSVTNLSSKATQVSFTSANSTSYFNIFNFLFSQATLISRFFSAAELLVYFLLFVLLAFYVTKVTLNKEQIFLLTFLLIMIFLGTGAFLALNLGTITTFYPLLREVGHFAPIIMLTLILLLASLESYTSLNKILFIISIIAVGISSFVYFNNPQSINYATMRKEFQSFENFSEIHKNDTSRILTYPFFDQYQITSANFDSQGGFPLKNTGHDSFTAYASGQYLNNTISPQNFDSSLQYYLLTYYDLNVLKPFGVRYIYDFSKIYESNYNKYVPASTYDNNLGLIKNNPDFLEELSLKNPGQMREISPGIWQVLSYTKSVSSTSQLISFPAPKDINQNARSFVQNTLRIPFIFTDSRSPAAQYSNQITSLYSDLNGQNLENSKTKGLEDTVDIPKGQTSNLYTDPNRYDAYYDLSDNVLKIYIDSAGTLKVNGRNSKSSQNQRTILTEKLDTNQIYYLSLNNKSIRLSPSVNFNLGPVVNGDSIKVFEAQGNQLISNPSFDTGPWEKTVGDCDNYDKDPIISMSIDTKNSSVKDRSMQLTAQRHDACESTNFNLKSQKEYVLSYDYESPNNSFASFYLGFNGGSKSPVRGEQATQGSNWQNSTTLFNTTNNTHSGRLFVYALETNQIQNNIVRYDNFKLSQVALVYNVQIPSTRLPFVNTPLSSGRNTFSYTDNNYSFSNIIKDSSFNDGLWQKHVSDCDNYDSNPVISMNLDKSQAFDSAASLQLSATRHDACTYTSANVDSGATYLLAFDYKVKSSNEFGYDVTYNNTTSSSDKKEIKSIKNTWQTYYTEITIPEDASTLSFYFYAFETNGITKNTVDYDNIKLIEVPDLTDRYYVVSKPVAMLSQPKNIQFEKINESRWNIKLTGVGSTTLINLSETYNPQWRLELDSNNDRGILSMLPGITYNSIINRDHFYLNDYSNAWLLNINQLCATSSSSCEKNRNGTYNVNLTAEFTPQREFNILFLLSSATIIVCTSFVILHRTKKSSDEK